MDCGMVTSCPQVAKLSVSGIGLRSHTGVAIRIFQAMANAGINIEMVNTSEVRVNVVIAGDLWRGGTPLSPRSVFRCTHALSLSPPLITPAATLSVYTRRGRPGCPEGPPRSQKSAAAGHS